MDMLAAPPRRPQTHLWYLFFEFLVIVGTLVLGPWLTMSRSEKYGAHFSGDALFMVVLLVMCEICILTPIFFLLMHQYRYRTRQGAPAPGKSVAVAGFFAPIVSSALSFAVGMLLLAIMSPVVEMVTQMDVTGSDIGFGVFAIIFIPLGACLVGIVVFPFIGFVMGEFAELTHNNNGPSHRTIRLLLLMLVLVSLLLFGYLGNYFVI